MRVAVITGEFPVISETFVIRQIIGLLDLGHDVDIYVDYRPRAGGVVQAEVDRYRLLDRTTYVDAPPIQTGQRFLTVLPRAWVCYRLAPQLTGRVLNPFAYGRHALSLSALHRLYRLATVPSTVPATHQARYDVVHAHFGMVGNRFRFASALWDVPLVVSFHGSDSTVYPRQHGRDCYRALFDVAAAITANSDHTRERLKALGCPPDKIHKLYSAWDMDAFSYVPHPRRIREPVRVLTVARLVEIKGIEYAIRAIARVRDVIPEVCYDIVGEGPLRANLEALISTLGLHDTVTLHGARPSGDVQRMMAQAHIFVQACVTTPEGDQEGQSLVLVEAQARGLAVVATRHGPFPEIVRDGVSAYLVPERDPGALAERLIYLIEHPDVAEALGHAARQHVEERFDSRALSRRTVDIYERAVARHRPSVGHAMPTRVARMAHGALASTTDAASGQTAGGG